MQNARYYWAPQAGLAQVLSGGDLLAKNMDLLSAATPKIGRGSDGYISVARMNIMRVVVVVLDLGFGR